jgi:heme exporter protein C
VRGGTDLDRRKGAAPRVLVPVSALLLLFAGVLTALVLVPADVDQGDSQRIFYIHVPSALVAYGCFFVGGYKAYRLLATGKARYELESHTAIHLGVVFASVTLATGSLWAKISWGVWWSWDESQLVLFLILFLFYSAYFMLRYSVPAGPGRARLSAVYALFGVVLIPISFLAIRLAQSFIHPVVFSRGGPQMAPAMFATFCLCLAGVAALAVSLYAIELAGRTASSDLTALKKEGSWTRA